MLRTIRLLPFLLLSLLVVPASSQPPPQPPVVKGQAVATCFSNFVGGSPANGISNDYVVGIIDVHTPIGPPNLWSPPMYHGPANSWRSGNMGQVFGIAIDKRNAIYVTATTAYGYYNDPLAFGPAGSGGVYRLDGVTGVISNASGAPGTFITTSSYTTTPAASIGTSKIPNGNGGSTRPGLGNICYAAPHDRLFVTNMEDGVIYRINPLTGLIDAVYDPIAPASPGGTSNPAMAADNGTLGFAPLGDRIWGIGYNPLTNRVYYSVWAEDYGNGGPTINNIIRSIGLDGSGNFQSGTDRVEVVIPDPLLYHPNAGNPTGRSAPISDIAFNSLGKMLLAERTMHGGSNPGAHGSRVLEYGGAYPAWTGPTQHYVGNPATTLAGQNAAGGIDYGYGGWDAQNRIPIECDSAIWSTGDMLANATGFLGIYGLQRSPASGNTLANVQTTGYFVDLNGLSAASSYDKTQIGDVEIYREPCDTVPPRDPDCDSLRIDLKKDFTYGDQACCFTITLTNNDPGTIYTQITATSNTPGVTITNATAPAGWTVGGTGTTAVWNAPITGVPAGTTTGLTFCLNIGLTNPPQSLTFTWVASNGQICTTTVEVDCRPPSPVPGCGILTTLRIRCREVTSTGTTYQVGFQVTNLSLFYVVAGMTIVNITPAGLGVAPTSFSFGSGIPTNGTSTPQTLNIFGPLAQAGDTVCLRLELFNKEMTWCCKFDTCLVLPPCVDCCDSTRIRFSDGQPGGGGLTHNGSGTTSISTFLTVTPKKIIRSSATVVSAHIKRFGCSPTGGWVPTSGEIITPQPSFGGLPLDVTPQPFSTPPPPNYREAIWGTVPAGASFSTPVPMNLLIAFPSPPFPAAGCYDSIRFCVRYTFTDTAWVTCDTIICYQQKRVGKIIIHKGDLLDPTNVARKARNNSRIQMTNANDGRLTVTLPVLSPEALPDEGLRIVGIRLEPSVGVRIASMEGVAALDNAVSVPTLINQGGSSSFDLVFDNYAAVRSWTNSVTYRYVQVGSPADTLEGDESVIARVPGDVGGDSLAAEKGLVRPTGVRTFMLYFANINPLYEETGHVTINPLYQGRILAVGPPPQDSGAITLVPIGTDANGVTFSTSGDAVTVPSGSIVRPVYLTLTDADSGKIVRLEYVTYNPNGEEVARGVLTLDDPLSTSRVDDDPDGSTTGNGVLLWPIAPNPSADDRTIHFQLPHADVTDLVLCDATGREVRRIIDGASLPAGEHVVILQAEGLASGVYYVVLRTSTSSQSASMRMVR